MRTNAPNYIATEQLIWLRHDGGQVRVVARVGLPRCARDAEMLHGLHGLRVPQHTP